MQGVINGKDVIMAFKVGDDYVPYVCAKDLTIETTASLTQVATIGDGPWDKFKYQSLGYTINMTGVARMGIDDFSAFEALINQINFLELLYKILFIDQSGLITKTIKGIVLIERNNISANSGQLGLNDLSLKGSGKLTIIDCDAAIGFIGYEFLAHNDVKVTISGVTGAPDGFYYQLDNQLEVYSTSLNYTFSNVPGGAHTVIITPVCASGSRGEEANGDFTNYPNPVNPVCGVPTMHFTAVTETSMTVNWAPGSLNTTVNIYIRNLSTGTLINYPNQGGTSLNVTGLISGAQYSVQINGNCGVETSQLLTMYVTMLGSSDRAVMTVHNYSTTVRVTAIRIGGVVVRDTPIEYSSDGTCYIPVGGVSDIEFDYNKINPVEASIKVITNSQYQCQPAINGDQTNTYTGISIPTSGVEVSIMSVPC